MRAALVATVAVALLATAGCSSDDSPSSQESQAADAAWSPCDGLTADSVSALVGQEVAVNTGEPGSPRCTFTPADDGGAAYDVSYLFFDGGLDAALDAMGATGEQLKTIDVAGADAARLVVSEQRSGVLVTGFVQTGGLVQSVNAVQVKPFDRARVVAGTEALLAELAAQAPDTAG